MSGVAKKLMGTTKAGGGQIDISDYFSTYLYTGNRTARDIVNGIDLAGEGGMVWTSARNVADNKRIWDSERGVNKDISTNSTAAQSTRTGALTAFNADGFSLGADLAGVVNADSGETYASWTFRKAPRFFDVVTWTGTGTARTIDHNLGTTVGSIIIKRIDTTSNWAVYHRGNTAAPETDFLSLNLTNATADDATYWNDTAPTDSVFTVGTNAAVNASGGTYVAYLFAHDPLGPSGDGSDGLIACGSYTGNGLADGPEIDLGWEPQWVMIKQSSSGGTDWYMHDNMRGIATGGNDARLKANLSEAEFNGANYIDLKSTGFKLGSGNAVNNNGQTHIYIAIRRGPMRAPTSGTEVFDVQFNGGNDPSRAPVYQSGFVTDMAIVGLRTGGSVNYPYTGNRLMGIQTLETHTTDAEESGGTSFEWDFMDGFIDSVPSVITDTQIAWMFRRAPEFFDVVAYTGNGVAGRTVSHNLGVAPEMGIFKVINTGPFDWHVLVPFMPSGQRVPRLNEASESLGSAYEPLFFGDGSVFIPPTSSGFTVSSAAQVNGASNTYIAYLFATLAGVSKVGSYTGNGTSQTIDCGFTTGARFILIKRTDSTGDWYVWDTARGIVAANDPHLSLNTTAAEVTTDDSIDPDSSGFIVNQVAATNINVSAASYIFYAVS